MKRLFVYIAMVLSVLTVARIAGLRHSCPRDPNNIRDASLNLLLLEAPYPEQGWKSHVVRHSQSRLPL